ncbi:gluconokinase [Zhongshania aliphaticivorans]|nr:gluconokinase, GntK/IdnK-type [Zhongshania aliphaticivorans]
MIIIVCGVSGTGKSTIASLLAKTLLLPFYDADDFHPSANIQKMRCGIALDDNDRRPWLDSLASKLAQWEVDGGAVLACSALKESYRQRLASQCSSQVEWIMLSGSIELLEKRLSSRTDHFFDLRLLDSQLKTLELPSYGWTIDISPPPNEIVAAIIEELNGT